MLRPDIIPWPCLQDYSIPKKSPNNHTETAPKTSNPSLLPISKNIVNPKNPTTGPSNCPHNDSRNSDQAKNPTQQPLI